MYQALTELPASKTQQIIHHSMENRLIRFLKLKFKSFSGKYLSES